MLKNEENHGMEETGLVNPTPDFLADLVKQVQLIWRLGVRSAN